MKKCIIYSILIYLLLYIALLSKKPSILYDNNNIKSLLYFQDKINNGYNSYNELVCLPTIMLILVLLSYLLAKKFSSENI